MGTRFEVRCRQLVESLGLCHAGDVSAVRRLSGGVASDIAVVTVGRQSVCVKFALEKLRVDEDWFAPVHRGRAEFAWLAVAGDVVPDAVPRLYGWSDDDNGFAMEYIEGSDVSLWKSELLAGVPDTGEAGAVATILGRIHAESTKPGFDREAFGTSIDFESLRIDPYLRFTAGKHPDIAPRIVALADQLSQSSIALVHGDISPKNILLRGRQPILLDAECASMGDPAFDVAFCLNHLLLKSIHLPDSAANLHSAMTRFWNAYASQVSWEEEHRLESRVTRLLPALMLARVDGKSPVDYLSDVSRARVRAVAKPLIDSPVDEIGEILQVLQQETSV
ncbi:MAG: aminoglycoside phosphotransferase family protein [Granulosicoccus sp.]|nr:aminoglycoside phosphotransferase family protein [Granulosicoccus sp.]